MLATLPPSIPAGPLASATVGPPAAGILGSELRAILPPVLVDVLDKIGGEITAEILDPLLFAPSDEQLTSTFERLYPKFKGLLRFNGPNNGGLPS
jgi:hypothetical protein